ncbi:MAG TPA: iron-sulfur cluster assembly scaffold protein [Thermodesulfobacteriota bacterium]|nr:iron-sulfur cluster assembly scaffold protein [Thermodesulfobacteriota bacterium]
MDDELLDDASLERLQKEMLEEARKIYSEKVIDHWLNPRNVGRIEEPQGRGAATGICGDNMEMTLRINNDRILDINFLTEGCGTTAAVGSMTTELAKGKTVQEALEISPEDVIAAVEGLPPEHRHCADLASTTLKEALKDYLANKQEPWKRAYKR